MFSIDGTSITLSRGDTGAFWLKCSATRRDTGAAYTFGERDRALFTVKSGNVVLKQMSYPIVDNQFLVVFYNQDTDTMNAGTYNWDVRYLINPYYEDDPPVGPWTEYEELTFPVASGTKCIHEGTYYTAKQAISTSEEFTPEHWMFADYRLPVDGDQVITPKTPMNMQLLTVVGDI